MKTLFSIWLSLFTAVSVAADYGVIFVGDTGLAGAPQTAVATGMVSYCKTNPCDVGLLLGDNMYPAGVSSLSDPGFKTKFEDAYKDLPFRFFAVLGNHDYYGKTEPQIQYESKHWIMPGYWFGFDGPVVNFYGLDTNPLIFPKAEVTWLEVELAKKRMPWRIAYSHHAIYSSGDHGDSFLLKLELHPILVRGQIDFYLTGHDHDKEVYEEQSTGIKHVVCGAGAKVRPVHPKSRSIFGRGTYGFCHLRLNEKSAVLRILDQAGKVEFEKTYQK